jgi:UDP-N-acetylglucosamine transferase subunit ALG13
VAATLHRCETWFIDSATRVQAPSSTGRFAQRFTRAQLFVQGQGWGDPAWRSIPSVFDAFEAVPRPDPGHLSLDTVVVSLGTELWPFDRAVSKVIELLPESSITWQTGVTEAWREGEQLQQWLPPADLRRAFGQADVVITHAGVGSVLSVLAHGKIPVILPRRAAHREMVDDHQVEFAEMIAARGLAISVDPSELSLDHLVRAAAVVARRRSG